MKEVWRIIEEFPHYEVSSLGNVRSIDRDYIDTWGRKYHKKGQMIKLDMQIVDNVYKQVMVSVWFNKKMHRLIVARLVAKAFIPNPNNYPQVNHKDEDSTNNCADNLEWCTAKYNIQYGNTIKRRAQSRSRAVDVYDSNLKFLETLSSGVEASAKYNVSRGMISGCCNGERKFAKGYHFKFHNK